MTIAVMALAPLGLWCAMLPGMVLGAYRRFIEDHLSEFWSKPLATCPRCMVTLFGTGAALLLGLHFTFLEWLVYVPCAVGLQEMFHRE